MSLGTFVAGPYTGTYTPPSGTAGDLGVTEQGFQISISYAKEAIAQTDRWAQTLVESVYAGVSSVTVTCLSLEYKSSMLKALFPYQATALVESGATYFDLGTIAVLDTDKAGSLIFTAIAGTTAATKPATWTATKAIMRANEQLQWAFDARLRKVPLPFQIYPISDTGIIKFWSQT